MFGDPRGNQNTYLSLPCWIFVTTSPTFYASKKLLGCIRDVFDCAKDILKISVWTDHLASFGRNPSYRRQASAATACLSRCVLPEPDVCTLFNAVCACQSEQALGKIVSVHQKYNLQPALEVCNHLMTPTRRSQLSKSSCCCLISDQVCMTVQHTM